MQAVRSNREHIGKQVKKREMISKKQETLKSGSESSCGKEQSVQKSRVQANCVKHLRKKRSQEKSTRVAKSSSDSSDLEGWTDDDVSQNDSARRSRWEMGSSLPAQPQGKFLGSFEESIRSELLDILSDRIGLDPLLRRRDEGPNELILIRGGENKEIPPDPHSIITASKKAADSLLQSLAATMIPQTAQTSQGLDTPMGEEGGDERHREEMETLEGIRESDVTLEVHEDEEAEDAGTVQLDRPLQDRRFEEETPPQTSRDGLPQQEHRSGQVQSEPAAPQDWSECDEGELDWVVMSQLAENREGLVQGLVPDRPADSSEAAPLHSQVSYHQTTGAVEGLEAEVSHRSLSHLSLVASPCFDRREADDPEPSQSLSPLESFDFLSEVPSPVNNDRITKDALSLIKRSLEEEDGTCLQHFTLLRMREQAIEEKASIGLDRLSAARNKLVGQRDSGAMKNLEEIGELEKKIKVQLSAERQEIAELRRQIKEERRRKRSELERRSQVLVEMRLDTIKCLETLELSALDVSSCSALECANSSLPGTPSSMVAPSPSPNKRAPAATMGTPSSMVAPSPSPGKTRTGSKFLDDDDRQHVDLVEEDEGVEDASEDDLIGRERLDSGQEPDVGGRECAKASANGMEKEEYKAHVGSEAGAMLRETVRVEYPQKYQTQPTKFEENHDIRNFNYENECSGITFLTDGPNLCSPKSPNNILRNTNHDKVTNISRFSRFDTGENRKEAEFPMSMHARKAVSESDGWKQEESFDRSEQEKKAIKHPVEHKEEEEEEEEEEAEEEDQEEEPEKTAREVIAMEA
eukprot:756153-Hanusia_phi.AAC.1